MAITNIMSLNSLKRDHTVVYDQQSDTFTVYDSKTSDTIAVFESNEKGLYLFTLDMLKLKQLQTCHDGNSFTAY